MAAPADFHAVLTNVSFNATTRGVLVSNADMENLNPAVLYTWTDENVDDLVHTLHKIPPTAASPYIPVQAIDQMKTVTYVCHHMIRRQ
jgi:DNA uptake protein ComE-like DNA-binding protein